MSNLSPPTFNSHIFQVPDPTASRSPCPALNAAASQGYLPRSGRDISFMQFLKALQAVYNLSLPLAVLLTFGGFLLSGRNGNPTIPFLGTIDLHDLARHGKIEHDGSLAHADAAPHAIFAPTVPDHVLLDGVLAEAKGEYLTMEDLIRVRKKKDILLAHEGRSLPGSKAEIPRGEIALILSVMGDGTKVSPQRLKQWMGEDRLPDGWTRPQRTQGLIETFMMARRIEAAVERANVGEVAEQVGSHDLGSGSKQD